MHFVSD